MATIKINKFKHPDILDVVDDGFNYFLEYRLDEVNTDDRYYVEAFIQYIDYLECRVDRLTKQLRK